MPKASRGKGDLASLKSLLVGDEQRSLQELNKRVLDHHARIGTEHRLRRSVAKIIAASLRDAEIAQHETLANAISPLVVAGIKREIRNSRDEMVDALYPILGRLVSAYVAAAFRTLTDQTNRRLESTLTGGKLALRLKSALTGKPYGDLVLRSQPPELTEVLLIERGSGVLVDSWRSADAEGRDSADSALVSSLLTAITEFAREAFAEAHGELRMLDTGTGSIYLRATPAYLIALHYTGQADRSLGDRIDAILLDIIDTNRKELGASDQSDAKDGSPIVVPELAYRLSSEVEPARAKPVLAYALGTFIAVAALGTIGWYAWQAYDRAQLHASVQGIIESEPQLAGYPFKTHVADDRSQVSVSGLGPAGYAWDGLLKKLQQAVAPVALETTLRNVAVPDSFKPVTAAQQDLSRTIEDLQSKLGAANDQVAALSEDIYKLRRELGHPTRRLREWVRDNAIFFDQGTEFLSPPDANAALKELHMLLIQTGATIRLVGRADVTGSTIRNRQLALGRANRVADELTSLGVPDGQILVIGRLGTRFSVRHLRAERQRRVDFELPFDGEPVADHAGR